MNPPVIQVENLSKQYHIGSLKAERRLGYRSLRDSLADAFATPFRRTGALVRGQAYGASELNETFLALDNISFEVKQGDVVGIIGRNGAGKSTLLKILSRITEPTAGLVTLRGRVGSLLEVGTGFHPELTGRENIYLNGAILGMKRMEIARKFDEIVAFAEVAQFIDTPVKHYSSGMYLRLAFAVAAYLEPEILLVDEVLAVGDAAFQQKCLGKMDDVAGEGRTVLFVSHNMVAVSALCRRCVYLKAGSIKADGSPDTVIGHYLNDVHSRGGQVLARRTDRVGNGRVTVTDIRWRDAATHQPLVSLISGQAVHLAISYRSSSTKRIDGFEIGLSFYTHLGQFIMVLNSQMANRAFESLPPAGHVYCHLARFPLMSGRFSVNYHLLVNGQLADHVENALTVTVETGDFFGTGISKALGRQGVYVPQTWSHRLCQSGVKE